ncbi:MAG: ribonuclease inhibitor [Ruminococcaceae bacterium]|nr:ribonuclease inhibitor [Oscillospiraceae bacterium]
MKTVLLRGGEPYHEILARELDFPPYYGRNLDALHDCLTDLSADTVIILAESANADPRLIAVLRDAEEENPHLRVYVG